MDSYTSLFVVRVGERTGVLGGLLLSITISTGSGTNHQAYCNGFISSGVSSLTGIYGNSGDCDYATKHASGDVKKNNINCSPTPPWAVVLKKEEEK